MNAECEEVRNSTLLVQRYKKHEKQMKGCAVELKVTGSKRVDFVGL